MLTNSRSSQPPSNPKSQLSEPINRAMQERGLSIKDLAVMLDVTYEHARRLVRGEGIPSRPLIRRLAEELGLDFDEINRLATADKIRLKFGTVPLELAGKNPEMEPVERAWPMLTADQKRDLIALVSDWVSANAAQRASGAAVGSLDGAGAGNLGSEAPDVQPE